MDISKVADISELKCLKSDQYDMLEAAQRQAQQCQANIQNLNARIAQLQAGEPKS